MLFSQNLFLSLPQLVLPVEFLFEILCVGAPPTCIACRISFEISVFGPRQHIIVC